ncbi:MOT3-like protein [Mya arenaria]|uniref:MOT3-like protein n=1 Tax=Mya arenaria TaxID=6604 RepID=A0ABY7G3H0_MYAAR|nr:MOT3-like protein [Mya arenaria]
MNTSYRLSNDAKLAKGDIDGAVPETTHHSEDIAETNPKDGGSDTGPTELHVQEDTNSKFTSSAASNYGNHFGWVVTFVAFIFCFIVDGIAFSFGMFYPELLHYFDGDRSKTAWIISLLTGTYLCSGPIASIMTNHFGYRISAMFGSLVAATAFFACTFTSSLDVMIVVYGLVGGHLFLTGYVYIGHYFTKQRALAIGIASCGSGVGGFVFAPLSNFLIQKYGWKGAMWILSGIVLNGVPLGILLRPIVKHTDRGKGSIKSCSKCIDWTIVKSPTFITMCLSRFACLLGFFVPFTYLLELAKELEYSSFEGTMLISTIGISNTVCRIAAGWVADREWCSPVLIKSVVLFVGGMATLLVPFYQLYYVLVIYCVVYGLCIAVFATYTVVILTALFGQHQLTSSFGLLVIVDGIAALLGPPLAGLIADKHGSYRGTFYFAGSAIATSGLILILVCATLLLEVCATLLLEVCATLMLEVCATLLLEVCATLMLEVCATLMLEVCATLLLEVCATLMLEVCATLMLEVCATLMLEVCATLLLEVFATLMLEVCATLLLEIEH